MAFETQSDTGVRARAVRLAALAQIAWSGFAGSARQIARRIGYGYSRFAAYVAPVVAPLRGLVSDSWTMRQISKTLLRRIIASNLLGLVILLAGLTYLINFNSWLIEAKIEHLREQSHIIAAAIASKAKLKGDGGSGTIDPLRDDPFAALEFSIEPESVVPLLPQLLKHSTNRARVYEIEGVLIADSDRILDEGSVVPVNRSAALDGKKPKTRNIFTRLTQWLLISSDLRVYKEINDANGKNYPEVRAALEGKPSALMMLAKRREKIVSVAMPIERGGRVRGALLLSTAPGAIDDVQGDELFAVLVLVVIAAAAALLASILLARTVGKPVRQLSRYANDVTEDIQAAEAPPRIDERDDEVGQLARSLVIMTRALYRRIEASEKFAADVAHELKNPLTAARSTAESLIYAKNDKQRDELVEQIQLELKRLNKLITDVSNASRLDAELALQKFEPVDLSRVVSEVVAMFRDISAGDGKHIEMHIAPTKAPDRYVISGQNGRIEQVLNNLLSNALSFTGPGGTVKVILNRRPKAIDLVVEDQGPGIDPDNLDKIFERFYTYRPTANASRGDNSGLGLAISREIVAAHGGRIWAANIRGDGGPNDADGERPRGARITVRFTPPQGRPGKRDRLKGGR